MGYLRRYCANFAIGLLILIGVFSYIGLVLGATCIALNTHHPVFGAVTVILLLVGFLTFVITLD